MYPYYPEGIDLGSHWYTNEFENSVYICDAKWPQIDGRVGRRYTMRSLANDDDTYIFSEDDMRFYGFQEIDKEDAPLYLLGGCGE